MRPASPGEPADSAAASQEDWREKYPGWETFEGKPHDPRFMSSTDPNSDPRYNTDLHEGSVLPRRPGLAMWVWLLVGGIIAFTLISFAMYIHFQKPAPRNPNQGEIRQMEPVRPVRAVADAVLPLRMRHHDRR
jgi:hypothetical protein